MIIKQFDKATMKMMRGEINAALKVVTDKYGIELNIGNITGSAFEFRTKLTARTSFNNGVTNTLNHKPLSTSNYQNDRDKVANLFLNNYGLKIGDTFKRATKTLTITGYMPSRPKKPVVLVDQNGKQFKSSVAFIKNYIKS